VGFTTHTDFYFSLDSVTALRPPSPKNFWGVGFPETQDDPQQAHLLNGARPTFLPTVVREIRESLPSQFEYSQPPITTGWITVKKDE
jgi:hypothetical protein